MKNYLIEMVQHHQNVITEYQNNVTTQLNKLGYESTTPVLPPTLFADQVKKTEFTDVFTVNLKARKNTAI